MHQLPVALLLHLLQGQVLIDDAGRFASRSIFFIVLFAVNDSFMVIRSVCFPPGSLDPGTRRSNNEMSRLPRILSRGP